MSLPDNLTEADPSSPLPVLSLDGAAEPTPVLPLPAASGPRFCRTCGVAWQSDWADCIACAARVKHAQANPLTVANEWRAMKSSLWLYFSLLLACAVGLGLSRSFGGVKLQLWDTAAISVITIAWCFASVKTVLPPLQRFAHVKWFGLAIGLSLVTYAIAAGVIHGLNTYLRVPDESMSKPFLQAGYSWAAIVLFICAQPAIIEELAFRGVIFAGLTRALSGLETVLVSALMFMTLHLSPARFPHTLALGVGAGFLRYRTKSIYPGMLMHFSHNFLCLAGEWLAR